MSKEERRRAKMEKKAIDRFKSNERRRKVEVRDVEAFVRDRCDALDTLRLPSLNRLTDRDLAWLSQAVLNA